VRNPPGEGDSRPSRELALRRTRRRGRRCVGRRACGPWECGHENYVYSGCPRGQLRARLGLLDEPLIVYLGQLIPRKRVDVLIHAVAELARAELRLVIVGPDMGSGAELRDLVQRCHLHDQVIFLDTLAGHARLAALADADVVAYASEDEVLGLVPLEALLCGTPVVVGGDCGSGETITKMTGGRVVPVGDVAALARALAEILDAQVRWRGLACQAQPAVRDGFGSASVAARLDQVYFEVARP